MSRPKYSKVKNDFLALLKETSGLDRHSRWSDTKKKIDSDPRYKAIDSSSRREDYFRDYIRHIKEEKSSSSSSRDKSKDRDRKSRDRRSEERDDDDSDEDEEKKAKEKQKRVEESLKKREEEVQKSLSSSLRDREKEQTLHKKEEAVSLFNALLVDLVRDSEVSWRDARKQLRKDQRYELAESLERDEKERLFDEHIENLNKKNKDGFHKLLDETSTLSLTSRWKEIKKQIKEDPRYGKFSSSDRKREREFENYIHEKAQKAKSEFRELLRECKIITYKSKSLLDEGDAHIKDIETTLAKDKRFLFLESAPEERNKILMQHIDDLHRKGVPPPPTATEPSRRK